MRRLLLLALLAALAAACGGDDDSGGGDGVAGGGLVVDVEVPDPLTPGEVDFTVVVENRSDDHVTLEFPSGQRADVQLLDDGEVVYTWSAARSFIQALGEETVPAGEHIEFELDDVFDVEPGGYELVATVTATGEDLSVSRQVAVEPRRR